ncbi:MAG TPA: DUF6526 family protein [Pyrinomonadaceae bacterium]|nr:hypothetical protein [Chloracidobacterium sp.]MBP9935990.1 hypothetical protein [Pyrinomonadaceae bacterium]MBK7803899.1 hypothetical protein [Chloracidobacterium sp.]MBK9439430.1 hypothetical protein [Chloracidobacterium sp.]MBL0239283.1 hypothetical protein [Chloracidobacterium sp.]
MADQQNYKNHTRWHPLFHFVVMPLLVLNFLSHIVRLFMAAPESGRKALAWWTLLSLTLILLGIAGRLQALKSQDRVIRLEERLRYKEVLDADLAKRASELPASQIISLRFAPDEELAGLVSQVLDGKLNSSKEIKMAIKNWRADDHRV